MTFYFRDRETGAYPLNLDTVRSRVDVLFGFDPDVSIFDKANVDPVHETPMPSFDPTKFTIDEGAPELTEGTWRQTWTLTPIPPPGIPTSVTRRQAKIVLSRAGLLAQADAAIAAMEGQPGEEARIDWADASVFERDNPLIVALGTQLGLSTAQIDDLFVSANRVL